MLKRRPEEIEGQPMQMKGVKDVTMRMMVGRADGAPTFAMRHFTVEPGGNTPRHSHNYEHEVYILEGAGRVEYDGSFHDVRAGDVLLVEPNKMHQFTANTPEALKFFCFVPISFNCAEGETAPTPGS